MFTSTLAFFKKTKTHKQQQKCDAERNWSTYDFVHSKIKEKTGQQC